MRLTDASAFVTGVCSCSTFLSLRSGPFAPLPPGRRCSSSKNRRASSDRNYFLAPGPAPGFSFKKEEDGAAGFGFFALGFFGSRLLLF